MRDTVVLYPGLGVGHLLPMVELSGLFLRRGLAVTVVVVEPPAASTDASSAVARAAEANPSIHLHVLPLPPPSPSDTVPPSAGEQSQEPPPACGGGPYALLRRAIAALRDYLRSVSSAAAVRALVFDMFSVDALDVAAELGVPAYLFYTSAASSLAVSLHMPYKQAEVDADFGAMGDAPLRFPGVPTFRASELPEQAMVRGDRVYEEFLSAFQRLPACRGMLVNTFEWLEARAVAALRDGACVPGRRSPPVYCVGPLVSGGAAAGEVENKNKNEKKKHECLAWLDTQPEKSVVFLCFGSMGSFPKRQLAAIADGLEMSGQRFLWVVRSPPGSEYGGGGGGGGDRRLPEPDLGELLPEGFLERTKHRGLVVKSWAPQAEVLRHGATGAFVTHCGWNSILEGITAGVPLLCWPLYAEQRLNKVFMVEGARVAVEVAGYDREVVTAEEVEAKVRWVMGDSEDGIALRRRALEAKEKAMEAMQQGGTSHNDFLQFLEDLGLDECASQ